MDDLLDLDWKQQPSSSTAAAAAASQSRYLNTSSPNYYASPTPAKPTPIAQNKPAVVNSQTDAFASLFTSSPSKQQANLSLAEAQKKAQQRSQEEKRRNDALWSGIDSAAWSSSATSSPALKPSAISRTASPAVQLPKAPSKKLDDPWDLDAFASSLPQQTNGAVAAPHKPSTNLKGDDPFDFATFDDLSTKSSVTHNYDAQDDDDGILGDLGKPVTQPVRQSHLLDPRVATLSTSSVVSSAGSSRVPSPASGSRSTLRSQANRSGSPPPHIVGQIVEMGFSPAQARKALAQTSTGTNVEAALELLVGSHNSTGNDEQLARQLQQQERGPASTTFHDSDDEESAARQRRHRRAQDPRAARNDASAGVSPAPGAAEWQQQADQLYAQASEIGVSVLSKATAFWSSAKAQAQKALDERNRGSGDERSTTPSDTGSDRHRNRRWGATVAASTATRKPADRDGKPRWMMDAEGETSPGQASVAQSNIADAQSRGFKDSDDEQEPTPIAHSVRPAKETQKAAASVNLWDDDNIVATSSSRQTAAAAPRAPQTVSDKLKAASSTTANAKTAYISPNRRGGGSSRASPVASAPKIHRQDPPVSAMALQTANKWKEEGNELFRKGTYDQAELRYTKGIDSLLPDFTSSYCATGDGPAVETAPLRLLPLLSNRANSRARNGDAAGTIADCNASLRILFAPFYLGRTGSFAELYRPGQEQTTDLGDGINLREAYGKAVLRRAQAYEATEKWTSARDDWSLLERFEKEEGSGPRTGSNHLKFAREGLARCDRMLGAPTKSKPAPASASKRAVPRRPAATSSAAAAPLTAAYKATLEKQVEEDTTRFQLKDSVDTTIETWSKGKETNLRALLSSLHTILPAGLGWQPVPLHQILDPKGLKKAYTRAITKLHPDKIRTENTQTTMIASAAFHTLNQAWNATTL